MALLASSRFVATRARPTRAAVQVGILAAAVGLLVYQLRDIDLVTLFAHVRPAWIAAAVVAFVVSLGAAAHNITAFAPVRLRAADTLKAQLAIGGLRVLAPSALSTPAIGTRFLVRHGLSISTSVTVLAMAQGAQLMMTAVVVGVIALLASAGLPAYGLGSVEIGAAVVTGLAVVVLIARRLPIVDRALRQCVVAICAVGTHLRNNPRRVLTGLGASGALTLAHIAAFGCCVRAAGGSVSVLALTVVFLGAASVGSLVPTPAGVGAVETAMISGLVAAGLAPQVAAAGAVLSRLVTVWIPALPGLWALRSLRRDGLV